ncbi:hypothetical protein [Actinomadura rudentiformis]|uniref:Uncharacterized protein n=1 Tax=Actinomadura rudentiformis TaxID=359158 RepID=A0A6H9YRJ3_9ACTN|nr:hypothetical protein [Actinomadura rudentiformis]KAB2350328.1 hypothetical protein F8566_11170 [Actinomadura rudentiformis]
MKLRGLAALSALFLPAGVMTAGVAEAAPKSAPQKWKFSTRTNVAGDDSLGALAVTGRKSAWAAGGVWQGPPLLYRWNGSAWRRVKLPAHVNHTLEEMDATSDKNVWAFGGDYSSVLKSFHWNGKSWKTSVVERGEVYTWDAEVISSKNVWLSVSEHSGRGQLRNWNGRKWRSMRVPAAGRLYSLSFSSGKSGWAVGTKASGGGAVAVRWNGSSWKPTALPRIQMPKGSTLHLGSVLALSSRNVYAVGSYSWMVDDDEEFRPIVLHWNGSKWRRLTGPKVHSNLSGLTTDGRGGLWMNVGGDRLANYRAGRWTVTRIPGPAGQHVGLDAMANVPGTATMLGVGYARPDGPEPNTQDSVFFTAR